MPRLRRSDCSAPGIARRRRGRGFEYLDPEGQRVDDAHTLARIDQLAIPPAWRDVWICDDEFGHLQATGIDAAGRKQYLYHDRWRQHRDRLKFESMLAFARKLPRLRRGVERALAREELDQERVLGCAVRLLDLGFFRIGSEDYAEQNGSYGLASMRKHHVSLHDQALIFDYTAKSGRRRVQAITDPDALSVVATLKRRRTGADQLLAYRADRAWVAVRSEDINSFIKTLAGDDFTAKDFRTWNATVLAALSLAEHEIPSSKSSRERNVRRTVQTVAAYLGNTPAVCRRAYIDPRVFDRYRAGRTVRDELGRRLSGVELADARARRRIECAVLNLCSGDR
jgi:DNA topoisomerase I